MVRIDSRKKIGSNIAVSASAAGAAGAAGKKTARAKTNNASFANSLAGIASSSDSQSLDEVETGYFDASLGNKTEISASEAIADISLLAIQEQNSKNQQKNTRREAIELGEGLLKKLAELNIRIVSQTMSDDKLLQLKQFFAQKREPVKDDRLRSILAEIDLRVQVELAKRRK